jgi:hypothetical protein
MEKKIRNITVFVIIIVVVLSSIFCIIHFSGFFYFTLRTEFPPYPSMVQYFKVSGEDEREIGNPGLSGFGSLGPPSENQAIIIAQEYLESYDLLPDDAVLEYTELECVKAVSDGNIVAEMPLQYYVSFKRILENHSVVGPGDTLFVYIAYNNQSSNNDVVFCYKRWRNLTSAGEIEIISPSEAYKKLINKEILGKPMMIEPFAIYTISLGYYSYIEPEPQEFYKPVWIFYGPPESNKYYAVEACK